MKKSLLFACLALSTTTFAQFTDLNSPQVGDGANMWVIDTFVTNYAGTTGSGVTWDYSGALGVAETEQKAIAVIAASAHDEAASYPSSTIAIEIPGFLTSFNTVSATDYKSQGFIFTEPTVGDVIAKFNSNDELLINYPGIVTNSLTDAITGQVSAYSQNFPCSGVVNSTIDGSGTLILNDATTLTDVLRLKIRDSLFVDGGFFPGPVYMKRTQYEYYQLSSSSLPVFVHSSIELEINGGDPMTTGLVLSAYEPNGYLAVKSNELTGVSVFPNPANDVLNFNGLTEDATIQIYALNGQLVKTVELALGTSTISVEELNAGTYLVKATTSKGTLNSKITVK